MSSYRRSLLGLALCLIACGSKSQASEATAAASASGSGSEASSDDKLVEPLIVREVGFRTPQSVLYDAAADMYLVSNVDGSPLEADDHAFISRLRPNGSVETLKWIDSADPKVTLDAPKGMALVGDVLYVADITHLRKFDRRSGKALGSLTIPGATFLTDVAADRSGNVYVSDSGLTTGFAPSGSDAIYRIGPDERIAALAKGPELGQPHGLLVNESGLWVVSFGSGELYRVDEQGARADVHKLPKGSLDGIVEAHGQQLISSWEGSAVYRFDAGSTAEVVSSVSAPADIGYDTRRSRILIPLFNDDTVIIQQL